MDQPSLWEEVSLILVLQSWLDLQPSSSNSRRLPDYPPLLKILIALSSQLSQISLSTSEPLHLFSHPLTISLKSPNKDNPNVLSELWEWNYQLKSETQPSSSETLSSTDIILTSIWPITPSDSLTLSNLPQLPHLVPEDKLFLMNDSYQIKNSFTHSHTHLNLFFPIFSS